MASSDLAPNLALPWVVRLRYGMAAGEAGIVLGMYYGLRFDVSLRWAFVPILIVVLSNMVLARSRTLGALFCLDTLSLTALLGLTGGPMNPFSLLYLVQITLSAVVLGKAWTWALGALSTACFGLLFLFPVPSHQHEQGLSPHLIGMWLAFGIAAALITFFTGKIADALRTREQEILSLQEQVAKNERLASLVTLSAGAAHELGTPLATIAVVAKELERYAATESVLEDAKLIRSEVERCRAILERMSARSAGPMGEVPDRVQLRDFFAGVLAQFPEPQRALLNVELADETLAAVLPVHATAQSVAALIQNALDANVARRPILITAASAGSDLRIRIQDQGEGMPVHVLRRIAEPFFTTKEPGQGMGLGTFLVRTFAQSLGGELRFDSIPGAGTTVTLELPHAAV
jgi:two-component system sensor histidine kinase RegB